MLQVGMRKMGWDCGCCPANSNGSSRDSCCCWGGQLHPGQSVPCNPVAAAARVSHLQQAPCHFPFKKQAKEKGAAILLQPASPRANDCPAFLLEVMNCSTGIWRPRVSGQAAVSKITPPSSLHAHHPKINVDAISNHSSVPANGSSARDALLPP